MMGVCVSGAKGPSWLIGACPSAEGPGLPPRLLPPASGRSSRALTINTPSGRVKVAPGRVTKAPAPAGLPEGVSYASGADDEIAEERVSHKSMLSTDWPRTWKRAACCI